MKYYNILEAPFKVTGLHTAEGTTFRRLPKEVTDKVPRLNGLAGCTAGGCVRFMTDTKDIELKVTLTKGALMSHMPLSGQSGVDIYFDGLFVTTLRPANATEVEYSGVAARPVTLDNGLHKVELFLPLYNGITAMQVGLDDKAVVTQAPEFAVEKPVAFYGSSITQGGCASKPGNAFTNILARWLDFESRNLGFSGSAKGEPEVAEYIAALDLSAFVYDYDHNAYALGQLDATHKPFFDIIRKARPDLPIVIVSRPDFDRNPQVNAQRRAVIFNTYMCAKWAHDDKVWFVDGEKLFDANSPIPDRRACTIDGCHPNDLGFFRMAETIYPTLKEALGKHRI